MFFRFDREERAARGWLDCAAPLLLGRAFPEAALPVAFPPETLWIATTSPARASPADPPVCAGEAGAPLRLTRGDELKLVFPQAGAPPEQFEDLGFPRLLLQPMDGPDRDQNTKLAVEYCLAHPQWRLSLQTHKYLGIP